MGVYRVDELMEQARRLAADYRRATGRALPGVSAELAVHDAVRLLGLEPGPAGAGWDAEGTGERAGVRYQVKGRAILNEARRDHRIGELRLGRDDWDAVLLVLMDEDYHPTEIWEAARADVEAAVAEAAASGRRRRGALSVARFRNIGELVWTRETGRMGEVWDNRSAP
ncbi:hypothetical protein [Inmirania thermothiophila]|uniref:Uncharacterized protein n=1 Tax=Inmirania thermothiophila TaxID=1750597 RepID=A0A3N1Y1D5_9GAMM|nr:hypothetical protein EDC57_1816 [Inmirania thermothiophila]